MRLRRLSEQGRAPVTVLAAVCVLAGVGIGSIWYYRQPGPRAVDTGQVASEQGGVVLSDGTKAVLQRLRSTVEIRFYAVLNPPGQADALQEFAAWVEQLLSAYRQEAGGRIKVVQHVARSDFKAAAAAAEADGITPFRRDTGDVCHLGLVVLHNGRKESLPQLSADWRQALESDLSRAIARLIDAPAPADGNTAAAQPDPAIEAEVRRQIPNLASVSVEEGARMLRASAIKDFQSMAGEMAAQVKEAEQRVTEAQAGKSEAELQAALKRLQELRAEQAAKLKEATEKATAQIEAFRRLKEAGR